MEPYWDLRGDEECLEHLRELLPANFQLAFVPDDSEYDKPLAQALYTTFYKKLNGFHFLPERYGPFQIVNHDKRTKVFFVEKELDPMFIPLSQMRRLGMNLLMIYGIICNIAEAFHEMELLGYTVDDFDGTTCFINSQNPKSWSVPTLCK